MKIKSKLTALAILSMGAQSAFADGGSELGMEQYQPKAYYEELTPIEEAILAGDSVKAGGSYFVFLAASSATPYESGYTTNYAGGGCMNAVGNGGTAWLDQNLNLPSGHSIGLMRFYYVDSTASDTTQAILFQMNGDGTFTSIDSVVSSTDTGAGSDFTTFTHVVDNTAGALIVRFEGVDDNLIEACGVRFVVNPN
ncbi:hypothetical protein [Marinicella meishanensis]|uniref:hypothetical protein n=1 Tax=Marinicella meishanensis TaxID=2873263 RepID=UPI001CBDF7EF|nr:hypothetical protein [Marinicella sp. NBU2979]